MTEKSYIFIWKIDVGNVAPSDVPTYMSAIKQSVGNVEGKLNHLLNADVEEYFIPVTNESSNLDIVEFNLESDSPYTRTSNSVNPKADFIREKIAQILKDSQNVETNREV